MYMQERRIEPRLLCADLVQVTWKDASGQNCAMLANLEDISESGACLQMEGQVSLNTQVRIICPNGEFTGEVRYCVYKQIGYYVGVQFGTGTRWSQRQFRPQHLFDPRRLTKVRTRPRPTIS